MFSTRPGMAEIASRQSRRGQLLAMFTLIAFGAFYDISRSIADEVQTTLRVPTSVELRRADWISEGRTRFAAACSRCHGMSGESGIIKPFSDRTGWPASEIHDVILRGRIRGAVAMPAWGGSMPDEEIWKLVAYIKSLATDFEGLLEEDQE